MIHSCIHFVVVLFQVHNNKERDGALICMFASCLLCIAHKKTTNKEESLRRNEQPSLMTNYWNALPVWQIISDGTNIRKLEMSPASYCAEVMRFP